MPGTIIFGGIEGGATHSKAMLYSGSGKLLVECAGPGTNHWMLGMEECQKRIYAMISEAKTRAGVSLDTPLDALGMSLSGCEQEETNNQLKEGLKERYPLLSKEYVVCSDTVGSVAAAHHNGGVVVIAGTGSNALLLNPDGSECRCGGWGHLLGDEGGAWWIAHKAIKVCFDEQDNFAKPPFNTAVVWENVKQHFNVKNRFDLLDHCYSKFDKPTFAGLCKRLAGGAESGDELCLWLFAEAGRALARFINALIPNAHPSLLKAPEGLPVVCVGSVWISWDFLRPGFIAELNDVQVELSLLKLNTSMAVGAVYLAAKQINFDLPRNYEDNYTVFYKYTPNKVNNIANNSH